MYHLNGPLRGGEMLTKFRSMGPRCPRQGKAHGMNIHWAVSCCAHSGSPAGPRPHTHPRPGLQGSLGGQAAPLRLQRSPQGRHEGLEAALGLRSGGAGASPAPSQQHDLGHTAACCPWPPPPPPNEGLGWLVSDVSPSADILGIYECY